jgi:thioesterase domain-containing protein
LAGFCIGGLVALEMAQQLIASGEEAPLLAMVETWHPSSVPVFRGPPATLRPWVFVVRGIGRHIAAMFRLPLPQAVRYFYDKVTIVKEMMRRRDVYRGDRYKRYVDRVWEANYRAGSRYVPAAYAGRIVLYLAANLEVAADSDTRLVWCELALDGCEVVRINAAGLGALLKTPHVKVLAEHLAERLREASGAVASRVLGSVS